MNAAVQLFTEIGEPFAAGFFELPHGSVAKRFCRAYRRYYETCRLFYREGTPLFPAGSTLAGHLAVRPCYCRQYDVDWEMLEKKSPEAAQAFRNFSKEYNHISHWNHSVLNYKRILEEGFNRYEERVSAMKNEDLREALLDVLAGIKTYHRRALAHLKAIGAPGELIEALEKTPYSPASTAYEALVSINFALSLDGWDNAGRLDAWLKPYFQGEDLTPILHCLMENIQDNGMWSVTLGPDYNEITYQVIRASEGLARPMVQLRVNQGMPEDLWRLATERVLSGGGQPSFYNEAAIQRRLTSRLPDAPAEDILQFTGAGCTETCFAGMTYSGGIDMNLNVLFVFEKYMKENLSCSDSFEAFYEGFCREVSAVQDRHMEYINHYYNERAKRCFAPIRTLFVDDCIDKEIGYHQGGARYTFAVPSDSGIPNTVDSLLAIQELVYEKKLYSAQAFLSALEAQDARLTGLLLNCPHYGVGNPQADALMQDFTSRYYRHYASGKLDLGLGFFPTSHQFMRHTEEGTRVGATPDGRKAASQLADSIAAVNGKAEKGPTLMLLSAAKYVQEDIYGIPVLNLAITRKYSPAVLRALVESYFDMGGTQIQITAVDRKTLLEAREDPQRHRDLIVRVGGYSEYFRNLTDDLKDAVVERTLFGHEN